jgi:hypothetical protein
MVIWLASETPSTSFFFLVCSFDRCLASRIETTRSRQTDIGVRSLYDVEVSSSNARTSVVEVDSAEDAGHMLIARHRPPACAEGRDTKKSRDHRETATRTSSSKSAADIPVEHRFFVTRSLHLPELEERASQLGVTRRAEKKEFKPLQIGWTI